MLGPPSSIVRLKGTVSGNDSRKHFTMERIVFGSNFSWDFFSVACKTINICELFMQKQMDIWQDETYSSNCPAEDYLHEM